MSEPIYDDQGNVVEPQKGEDLVNDAPDGLTAVLRAYIVAGPGRKLHNDAKKKLHTEWPTLAYALDRLVDEELTKRLG